MINSIKNDDQPLPRVTLVSIAGTSSTEQPPLKDKSMWSDQEKRIQNIDRLGRSLLIQGLPNDIYSLIDSNKTAKDLWDALARHILVLNMNKNLMDINIDALYNILKQNQGDVNDAMGSKKKTVVVTSDPLALIAEKTKINKSKEKVVVSSESEGNDKQVVKKANKKKRDISRVKYYNCKKEGHFARDCKKAKVKDYEYYKTKMFLAKKDKDFKVLLAEDQAWMESSSDSDQEINANMIFEISYYLSESESESEFETLEYYDDSTDYGLFMNNDDDQESFHDAIESANENFIENHIGSQKDYDKSGVDNNDSEEKDHLVYKLIRKFNKKIVKCQKRIKKANQQSKDFENQNKDSQDKYDVLKNQAIIFEMNNKELNEQLKELIEKNNDLLAQTKKKKGSSNTSNVDLSAVSHLNLNKNVKRYSRKDLLACNNSHLGETSSAYMCNNALNVSCNPRFCDVLHDNNFFIFDGENVRISRVSKMPFRKKPCDYMKVRYKSNMKKSLPRTFVQIYLWIIDLGCSKHMRGNRALLMNFMEKFLGTVRFGNNDFAMIAGYGDVVFGSLTIKKFYYVEGLGHNLFSVGQFCDKGLKVFFRKSTCFVRNEDGVDLLTSDRLSNLYTIALNEVASNSSTYLLAKAFSS
nr:integrase, catalytic region, zinc finger, CCHC-type, peptidase aspartic, catalytic [Tanacetum cinerariifolium]